MRSALVVMGLVAASIAAFDLVGWFLISPRQTAIFANYRKTSLLEPSRVRQPQLSHRFARHYFRPDPSLGFDIRPGASGQEEIDGIALPTFANGLGCFDRNEAADFRGRYAYFAGDSHTWGNAHYESKFATTWERLTGHRAAKCGVTHTGQLHQFEKFRRFVADVGSPPSIVFVGFSSNDPANDAVHPHSTVIDGYLVDTVYLKDGELVRPPVELLEREVTTSAAAPDPGPSGFFDRARSVVWIYSLSANILDRGRLALHDLWLRLAGQPPRRRLALGDHFYDAYSVDDLRTRYAGDARTERNRTVLEAWSAHARENRYRLVLLLIPPYTHYADRDIFREVRGWLDRAGIEYLDLAATFGDERLTIDDLYWQRSGYWSSAGNVLVGRLLAARHRFLGD